MQNVLPLPLQRTRAREHFERAFGAEAIDARRERKLDCGRAGCGHRLERYGCKKSRGDCHREVRVLAFVLRGCNRRQITTGASVVISGLASGNAASRERFAMRGFVEHWASKLALHTNFRSITPHRRSHGRARRRADAGNGAHPLARALPLSRDLRAREGAHLRSRVVLRRPRRGPSRCRQLSRRRRRRRKRARRAHARGPAPRLL